jgi:hypothetical protein
MEDYVKGRIKDGFRPGIIEQWLKSLATQINKLDWPSMLFKSGEKAFKVLLAGFAIGFTLVCYLILEGTYPGIGISEWSAGLVLFISLEHLYSDPIFVLAGSLFLGMVAAVCTAAMTAQLSYDLVVSITLGTLIPYLIGILIVCLAWKWMWKLVVNTLVRIFLYGETQQTTPETQETSPAPQV